MKTKRQVLARLRVLGAKLERDDVKRQQVRRARDRGIIDAVALGATEREAAAAAKVSPGYVSKVKRKAAK